MLVHIFQQQLYSYLFRTEVTVSTAWRCCGSFVIPALHIKLLIYLHLS